jgi:PPOX class probable F420-dependent enzyme
MIDRGGGMRHVLSEHHLELLREPHLAYLATVAEDGSPHVTPVWADEEHGRPVVNTADGRAKVRHVRRDPRVGLLVMHRDDVYDWVSIRGRVVDITTDGAEEHIDRLSHRYEGKPFAFREGQVRLKLVIEPDRVTEYR